MQHGLFTYDNCYSVEEAQLLFHFDTVITTSIIVGLAGACQAVIIRITAAICGGTTIGRAFKGGRKGWLCHHHVDGAHFGHGENRLAPKTLLQQLIVNIESMQTRLRVEERTKIFCSVARPLMDYDPQQIVRTMVV